MEDKSILFFVVIGFFGYQLWVSHSRLSDAQETIKQQEIRIQTTDQMIDKLRNF